MATTEIQASITSITGVTPDTDLLTNAQKFVAASIPKNLMWAYASKTAGVTSNPVTNSSTLIHTDNILGVDRNGFSANQVGFESKGFIGADSGSLFEPTKRYPKWLIAETNEISIYPAPEAGEEGSVLYVNYGNIADTSDLRNAVIFHASAQEFEKIASGKVVNWIDLVIPVPPTSPNFGSDLTISITSPVVPSLSDSTVSFSTSIPTYTPPVMSSPDFVDTNTLITDEEDSEMLASRVQEIQAKIAEYSSRLAESQAVFNKENAEYQAQLQISIQDAQLSSQDDAQKIQKYGAEVQTYQQDMNKEIQDFVNTLQKETQEYQGKVTLYNSDLQKYQSEIGEKTAKIGSATQNAVYYSKEADKYYKWANTEVQMYIQNNSKMINSTIAAQAAQQQSRR